MRSTLRSSRSAPKTSNAWGSLMWEPKRPDRPSKSRGAHRCKECGGDGRVPGITKTRGIGMGSELGPCPACDGTGWLSDQSDDAQTLHNVRELTPEEFEQHFGELPTDGEG